MRDLAVWHDEMHCARHEHYQQDVTRRAREVRTRTPGYVLLMLLFSMFVVFVTPTSAMAESVYGEVISGPSEVPVLGMYGASIAAPDRYTAAALLMGYGPDAIAGWDYDVKAKLSNAETGGNFFTFATNSVQNYFDVTEHTGIFQGFLNFVGGAFWNAAQALYGNNLWAAVYTSEELAAAKADLERVLSGENIGGGGSGSEEQETGTFHLQFTDSGVTLKFNRYYMYQNTVYYPNDLNVGGTTTPRSVPDVVYKLTNTNVLALLQDTTLKVYIWGSDSFGGGGNGTTQLSVMITDDAPVVTTTETTYNNQTWTSQIYTWTYHAGKRYYYVRSGSVNSGDGFIYYSYDIPANNSFTTITANIPPTGNGTNIPYFMGAAGGGGGGGGEPVVPPTNWPEPDVPEPPELPEPGDPVIEPPEPYEPTTGPTFIWNITNTSEPTDTSDLLEWIKKIFYELKAIHSDLKTWFENLGDAITDGFEAMDNACGQIYGAITEQTDEMISQFSNLKSYLKQLFNWLGEKMNFQASGYDDTSVIYWLKRIWSKLGNGDINVRPTDPTTDPTGVWDWLLKLIQNFLIGLASSANDLISEMADLISQVMHQFPFSIPWDIAAFLAAFAAAPITPDVDVTIPAIDGWWGETVISIDLSPYDTAAAAVRAMEKILFAAFLAWKSKDLLEFMDVTKWFNG